MPEYVSTRGARLENLIQSDRKDCLDKRGVQYKELMNQLEACVATHCHSSLELNTFVNEDRSGMN
ncbi:hypothetical protein J6590_057631 [Homalodisca vitripennis]|nr:hypothetical protein J6590_057631 [Homalodisca vitripennis]